MLPPTFIYLHQINWPSTGRERGEREGTQVLIRFSRKVILGAEYHPPREIPSALSRDTRFRWPRVAAISGIFLARDRRIRGIPDHNSGNVDQTMIGTRGWQLRGETDRWTSRIVVVANIPFLSLLRIRKRIFFRK